MNTATSFPESPLTKIPLRGARAAVRALLNQGWTEHSPASWCSFAYLTRGDLTAELWRPWSGAPYLAVSVQGGKYYERRAALDLVKGGAA